MFEFTPVFSAFLSKQLWLAVVLAMAIIPILRHPAKKFNFVDNPGGRKQHSAPAALVGGPAIIIAFTSTLLIFNVTPDFSGMLIGVLALFIIGLIDDKYDVSAFMRLVLQTLIVSTALWYDNVWLGPIQLTTSLTLEIDFFTYPITILIILGLQNSINMLDGIDGLVSGVVLIILGFLIGITTITGSFSLQLISLILFGAVLGFWAFNYRFKWRKDGATVFMGDSGTMTLGFILPYMIIKLGMSELSLGAPSLLIWLLAIPIWDMVTVVYKRILHKRSPIKPGRDHIHHTLMNAGMDVRQVLHIVYLLCLSGASIGMTFSYLRFSPLENYILFFAMLIIYSQRILSLDKLHQGKHKVSISPKDKLQNIIKFNSK